METAILATVSGLFSGFSLGLVGGGGSIIAVPLLVYVVGLNPHEAVAVSLAAVGFSALSGALAHARAGHVKLRVAITMALPGFLGVYVGSLLNKMVSGRQLLLIFAASMYAISARMVREALGKRGPEGQGSKGGSAVHALLAGLVVGVLSGFLGIGGGFLIVPALLWGVGLSIHDAVGTSLLVIFFNGLSGLASYWLQGRPVNALVTASFVAGGALGSLGGARVARRLGSRTLELAFALLVMAIATYIVARTVF